MALSILKVTCFRCGGSWKLHETDRYTDTHARCCPHCFAEVDEQVWKNSILPAFHAVREANQELEKDAAGYGTVRFSVNVISDRRANVYRG